MYVHDSFQPRDAQDDSNMKALTSSAKSCAVCRLQMLLLVSTTKVLNLKSNVVVLC